MVGWLVFLSLNREAPVWIPQTTEFKYAKLEISDLFAHPQVSFLLTLNKMTFQATLQRYGELLDIASLAQNEFDKPMQTLIRKKRRF